MLPPLVGAPLGAPPRLAPPGLAAPAGAAPLLGLAREQGSSRLGQVRTRSAGRPQAAELPVDGDLSRPTADRPGCLACKALHAGEPVGKSIPAPGRPSTGGVAACGRGLVQPRAGARPPGGGWPRSGLQYIPPGEAGGDT